MLKYFYIEGINSNEEIECAVIDSDIMWDQEGKIKFALQRAGYTGVLAYSFDDIEVMAHGVFLGANHSENILEPIKHLSPLIELNQPMVMELFGWALKESRDEFDTSGFGHGADGAEIRGRE